MVELFQHFKFTKDEIFNCYDTLLELKYLIGKADISFEENTQKQRKYVSERFVIGYRGFIDITDNMSADDVTTSKLEDIYFYDVYHYNNGQHLINSFHLEYTLKIIASKGKYSGNPSSRTTDIYCYFATLNLYSNYLVNALLEGKKKEFFANAPHNFLKVFLLYFCDFTDNPLGDPYTTNTLNTRASQAKRA